MRGFDLIRFNQNLSSKDKDSRDYNAKALRSLYYTDSKEKTIFSDEKIFDKFNNTIQDCLDEVDIPTISELRKDKSIDNDSQAAEEIDRFWVEQVKDKIKEALGTASSDLDDNLNKNQPKKYIDVALQKLCRLINEESLTDRNGRVIVNEKLINFLKNESEIDDNLDKLHRIRKIVAEVIKQID